MFSLYATQNVHEILRNYSPESISTTYVGSITTLILKLTQIFSSCRKGKYSVYSLYFWFVRRDLVNTLNDSHLGFIWRAQSGNTTPLHILTPSTSFRPTLGLVISSDWHSSCKTKVAALCSPRPSKHFKCQPSWFHMVSAIREYYPALHPDALQLFSRIRIRLVISSDWRSQCESRHCLNDLISRKALQSRGL